jgi:hypothetical protein
LTKSKRGIIVWTTNIALAYHSADREQAVRWLEQIKKWGGLGHHVLYLLPAFDCTPIPEILPFVGLTDFHRVSSDWKLSDGIQTVNASGPNSMFRQFARYFYDNKLGPFFFCEPDCIPLYPDSFDKLDAAYLACGKPYFGAYVEHPVPHLNGNSVWSQHAALIPSLILPMKSTDGTRDIAFDVAGGRAVLPQACVTNLIQHLWRAPSFISQEDFDARISKEALFYHSCKDGSIYKYLNGNKEEVGQDGGSGFFRKVFKSESDPSEFGHVLVDPQFYDDGSMTATEVTVTSSTTSPPSNSIEVQRARAAKARAALAAKRATGWRPERKKRKRKHRGKAKT